MSNNSRTNLRKKANEEYDLRLKQFGSGFKDRRGKVLTNLQQAQKREEAYKAEILALQLSLKSATDAQRAADEEKNQTMLENANLVFNNQQLQQLLQAKTELDEEKLSNRQNFYVSQETLQKLCDDVCSIKDSTSQSLRNIQQEVGSVRSDALKLAKQGLTTEEKLKLKQNQGYWGNAWTDMLLKKYKANEEEMVKVRNEADTEIGRLADKLEDAQFKLQVKTTHSDQCFAVDCRTICDNMDAKLKEKSETIAVLKMEQSRLKDRVIDLTRSKQDLGDELHLLKNGEPSDRKKRHVHNAMENLKKMRGNQE